MCGHRLKFANIETRHYSKNVKYDWTMIAYDILANIVTFLCVVTSNAKTPMFEMF